MAQVLSIDSIIRDPEIRQGSPVIAGTTIRVSDLAAYHVFDGSSPDELASQFRLELDKVHAALSYYYGHRAEIDAEVRAQRDSATAWRHALGDRVLSLG